MLIFISVNNCRYLYRIFILWMDAVVVFFSLFFVFYFFFLSVVELVKTCGIVGRIFS